MILSDEHADELLAFGRERYWEALNQFIRVRDHHGGDGTHPDVVKAKEVLDKARRLRCEVDPKFAEEQRELTEAA